MPPIAMSSGKSAALDLTPVLPDADVVRLVARFYEINLTDPMLTHYFIQSQMSSLRAKFARFVVHGLAGLPVDRPRLRRIHRRLGIGDIEFAACAKNLLTALAEQPALETKLKDQLLLLLWELEADITVEGGVPLLDGSGEGSNTKGSHHGTSSHRTRSYSTYGLGSGTGSSSGADKSGDIIYLDDLQEIAAQRNTTATSSIPQNSPLLLSPRIRPGWRSLIPW
ncbi:hypothetical protein BDF19DRAFT_448752 [Syncephalis fuscata]|nr:hypothetical protein BDF19DRAFT_448752 [Syncephalis fuscata]